MALPGEPRRFCAQCNTIQEAAPSDRYCFACAAELPDTEVGQLLIDDDTEFVVLRRLGRGGMGAVFEARDRDGMAVALKLIDILDPAAGARRDVRDLMREPRLLNKASHPRVVKIWDWGKTKDGRYLFLSLELLSGEELRAHLRRGPLPCRRALQIIDEVLDALSHAHRMKLAHGDLKPENIFLTRGGVKLLDFGTASMRSAFGGSLRSTQSGQAAGTPLYMTHGQVRALVERGGPIEDPFQTDVFQCGAVFYEMLTGGLPWTEEATRGLLGGGGERGRADTEAGGAAGMGQGRDQLMRLAYLAGDPPRPSAHPLLRERSAALRQLLDDLLGLEGSDAPRDAQALRDRVRALPEWRGRRRQVMWLAGAAAALLLAMGLAWAGARPAGAEILRMQPDRFGSSWAAPPWNRIPKAPPEKAIKKKPSKGRSKEERGKDGPYSSP